VVENFHAVAFRDMCHCPSMNRLRLDHPSLRTTWGRRVGRCVRRLVFSIVYTDFR